MSLNWNFPYPSQRMPILAKNCVATSQPLAAQAGLHMLQQGGNAVDAAIAAAITLTVVEPTMNSIGSDAFAQVWDGKSLHGLNASGRAPQAWSAQHFTHYHTMPLTGWDTVTVPGAVSAWVELSAKFGKLPFSRLFEPAIHYATHGYLVTPITATHWQEFAKPFAKNSDFASAFLPQGRAPHAGELFALPAQAETLQCIAETRGVAFYQGELAEKIACYAQKNDGLLTQKDLAMHQPEWVTPLKQYYRHLEVCELPPNGQGLTVLIALGILQQFEMGSYAPDSADSLHLQIEAMKLAFRIAKQHIADPAFMTVTPTQLLDNGFLTMLAQQIDLARAQSPTTMPDERGTVYLTTADSTGMMVSFIQSHYLMFGAGIVVADTGISLQNRGACFTLEKNHPNAVAAGKRPFHTIIPAMVMHKQLPLLSFGVMGGDMQAQGHVQMLVRLVDYQQNPQTAIDAPRWYIAPTGVISVETGIKPEILEELQQRGHKIVARPMITFGGAQAIYCLEHGYVAASDPRKDGQAVGF